jgi:hypothetical protein
MILNAFLGIESSINRTRSTSQRHEFWIQLFRGTIGAVVWVLIRLQ